MVTLLRVGLTAIKARANGMAHKVVFLGDYIDRGPASADVIKVLRDHIAAGAPWIALQGNHEEFMVEAVAHGNAAMLESWMLNGGDETRLSYAGDGARAADDANWMAGLPAIFADSHRVYVHAMVDPAHELAAMPDAVAKWARYPQGADVGYRGKHVVHGHTPHKSGPELYRERTNLDCGAVFTGRLAIGVFDDEKPGGPIDIIEVFEPA